jgi:hypothetical protein
LSASLHPHRFISGGQTKVLLDDIGADYVPEFLGGAYQSDGPCTSDRGGHVTPLQREFDQHYGL